MLGGAGESGDAERVGGIEQSRCAAEKLEGWDMGYKKAMVGRDVCVCVLCVYR